MLEAGRDRAEHVEIPGADELRPLLRKLIGV